MFDTSVWIDFLKGKMNPQTDYFNEALKNDDIASCPVVFQELLQGAKEDAVYNKLYQLLYLSSNQLINEPYQASVGAANIYRTLRAKGITIRKPNDCLIAWYCLENDLDLVHNDIDFDVIAQHFPLKIWSDKT
jgi:predicted nucleic acid-binding protein